VKSIQRFGAGFKNSSFLIISSGKAIAYNDDKDTSSFTVFVER